MKDHIVRIFADLGWTKDRVVDCFTKPVDTFVGVGAGQASIWLHKDPVHNAYWLRDAGFTSAGENVLAIYCLYLPAAWSESELESKITGLAQEMDRAISQAYSVRMLHAERAVGERPAG